MIPIGLACLFLLVSLYAPFSINFTCNKNLSQASSVISCRLVKYYCWGMLKKERTTFTNSLQSVIEETNVEFLKNPDYEVLVLANQEKIKIANNNNYNYELWKRQSQQINDFVENDKLTSISVGENNASFICTTIYYIVILIAIIAIIWSVKINLKYTLTKKTNTLSIARYNRFTQTTREISLDEIKNVVLEKSEGIEDMTSRIVFKLKSGEDIPLTSWLDSFDGKDEVTKCIRQFLK